MDSSSMLARDYECKLYSLRLLKQALDNGLISWAQYNAKQEEFLQVVNFQPQSPMSLDTNRMVAIKVQEMEEDLERVKLQGTKRGSPSGLMERAHKLCRYDYGEEQLSSLEVLCKASYSSAYESYAYKPKYSTFTLGGTALLQTIYNYAYEHQTDIDSKYAYRFRDNEYKSNVRSTLHNTGAFTKMPTGEWTITGKLKSRK